MNDRSCLSPHARLHHGSPNSTLNDSSSSPSASYCSSSISSSSPSSSSSDFDTPGSILALPLTPQQLQQQQQLSPQRRVLRSHCMQLRRTLARRRRSCSRSSPAEAAACVTPAQCRSSRRRVTVRSDSNALLYHHHRGGRRHQPLTTNIRFTATSEVRRGAAANAVPNPDSATPALMATAGGGGADGDAAMQMMASSGRTSDLSCRVADNNRCFCVPQSYGPVEYPTLWTEFRRNQQLCDGVVRCADGTEFRIHRVILSAASPYFKTLFTNSINRNQPEQMTAYASASGDVFQKIIDFAYTGICEIDDSNVETILSVADQYECLGVIQLCCQYILDQLQPTNCLGILKFSRHYFCRNLEMRGRQYVLEHFTALLRDGTELERLTDVADVMAILGDDALNVRSEEVVFEAIRKWVDFMPEERSAYVTELLHCVRIGVLSTDFVRETMMQWSPIKHNEKCKEYIRPVFKLLDRHNAESDAALHPMLRPRIPHDILFAVGGWSAGSPTNFVEVYDTRADRWLLSNDNDTVPRAYHGLCAMGGLIYMIGGFDGSEHFNTVRCFDPITHTWRECACMHYPRCYVSVAMHNDKIYALGGYNGRMRMNSAERYDPSSNQWEMISPMQKQRSDASAAVLDDKIYIVGGFNGQEVMSSAEMYDTKTDQWTFIPAMISARSGVSLVAFKNTLYALGGFNGYTRLTTGEKYQPGNNNTHITSSQANGTTTWVQITEMYSSRSNFATVILDDLIFVIGGFNGSTTINYVECYDTEANEWFDAAPMNLNRSALSACVISGLPNAKDYSYLGRTVNSGDAMNATELPDDSIPTTPISTEGGGYMAGDVGGGAAPHRDEHVENGNEARVVPAAAARNNDRPGEAGAAPAGIVMDVDVPIEQPEPLDGRL